MNRPSEIIATDQASIETYIEGDSNGLDVVVLLSGAAGAGQHGPARDVALGGGLILTEQRRAGQRLRTGIPAIEEALLHLGARSDPRRRRAHPHHDLAPVG